MKLKNWSWNSRRLSSIHVSWKFNQVCHLTDSRSHITTMRTSSPRLISASAASLARGSRTDGLLLLLSLNSRLIPPPKTLPPRPSLLSSLARSLACSHLAQYFKGSAIHRLQCFFRVGLDGSQSTCFPRWREWRDLQTVSASHGSHRFSSRVCSWRSYWEWWNCGEGSGDDEPLHS